MSGAEIIGLAASVVQLADVGLRLSVNLCTYTRKVRSADKSIKALSNEIASTGAILRELGIQFDDEQTRRLCKPQAITTAKGLVNDCKKVFEKLQKLVDPIQPAKKGKLTILQRVKFTFLETHIQELEANLDRLKSSLLVILNLLILAEQVRNKETPQVLHEQKQLLQSLVAETAVNEERHHAIVKLLKDSENNDAGSDTTLVTQPFQNLFAHTESLPEPVVPNSPVLPEGLRLHHSRILDHGRLVTDLLGQVSSQDYKLDHAHRMGLHNGILDIHWKAWSHMRKTHGHHVFLKLFGGFEDVARHWNDKVFSHSPSEPEDPSAVRAKKEVTKLVRSDSDTKTRLVLQSRTPCWICKSRKLKCDEAQPKCVRCASDDLTCDYRTSLAFRDDREKANEVSGVFKESTPVVKNKPAIETSTTGHDDLVDLSEVHIHPPAKPEELVQKDNQAKGDPADIMTTPTLSFSMKNTPNPLPEGNRYTEALLEDDDLGLDLGADDLKFASRDQESTRIKDSINKDESENKANLNVPGMSLHHLTRDISDTNPDTTGQTIPIGPTVLVGTHKQDDSPDPRHGPEEYTYQYSSSTLYHRKRRITSEPPTQLMKLAFPEVNNSSLSEYLSVVDPRNRLDSNSGASLWTFTPPESRPTPIREYSYKANLRGTDDSIHSKEKILPIETEQGSDELDMRFRQYPSIDDLEASAVFYLRQQERKKNEEGATGGLGYESIDDPEKTEGKQIHEDILTLSGLRGKNKGERSQKSYVESNPGHENRPETISTVHQKMNEPSSSRPVDTDQNIVELPFNKGNSEENIQDLDVGSRSRLVKKGLASYREIIFAAERDNEKRLDIKRKELETLRLSHQSEERRDRENQLRHARVDNLLAMDDTHGKHVQMTHQDDDVSRETSARASVSASPNTTTDHESIRRNEFFEDNPSSLIDNASTTLKQVNTIIRVPTNFRTRSSRNPRLMHGESELPSDEGSTQLKPLSHLLEIQPLKRTHISDASIDQRARDDDEISQLQDEAQKDNKLDEWFLEERSLSPYDWSDDDLLAACLACPLDVNGDEPGTKETKMDISGDGQRDEIDQDEPEFDVKRLQDEARKDEKLEAQLQSLGDFGGDIMSLLLQYSTLSAAEVQEIA